MGKVYAFYTELSKDIMHDANTYNPNNTWIALRLDNDIYYFACFTIMYGTSRILKSLYKSSR